MNIEELTKAKQIELERIYSKIPQDKREAASDLISQCAFMAAMLDTLSNDILQNGYCETYQNGEHQSGTKLSVSAKAYMTLIGKYGAISEKLIKLLPKSERSRPLSVNNDDDQINKGTMLDYLRSMSEDSDYIDFVQYVDNNKHEHSS